MKRKLQWVSENKKKLWLHVLMNAGILFLLLCCFRPAYETNDDMGIINMVSGVKGMYSAHLVYINYVLGVILSVCYRICQRIPWYAIFQYAAMFCAFTAVSYVMAQRMESSTALKISMIVLCLFSYEGYIKLQYTKTAGIVSAAGILLIFYALEGIKERKAALMIGYLLACVGFMYRKEQFLAELFLLFGVGLSLFLAHCGKNRKWMKCFLTCSAGMAGLFVILAVVFAVDREAYQSPEWQSFQDYNAARTELFDYGFPGYKQNKENYQVLEIDENAYRLYRGWNQMDTEKFTTEIMKALIALKEPKEINQELMQGFREEFPAKFFSVFGFLWCLIVLVIWIFWGSHGWREVAVVFYETIAVGILYFYLYYRGRYLYNRVDVGIWFAVVLALLWILPRKMEWVSGKTAMAWLLSLLCLSQHTWRNNWKINTEDRLTQRQTEKAVLETICSDQEHLYLLKAGTISMTKSCGVFETLPFGIAQNMFTLGGWPAMTPTCMSILERYGVSNPYRDMIGNDQIYLVDDEINRTLKYIRTYYEADAEAELVNEIGDYKVYQIVVNEVEETGN